MGIFVKMADFGVRKDKVYDHINLKRLFFSIL